MPTPSPAALSITTHTTSPSPPSLINCHLVHCRQTFTSSSISFLPSFFTSPQRLPLTFPLDPSCSPSFSSRFSSFLIFFLYSSLSFLASSFLYFKLDILLFLSLSLRSVLYLILPRPCSSLRFF